MAHLDFDKAARLSHLEFSDSEKQSFADDMKSILSLADSLCVLDCIEANKNALCFATPTESDTPKDVCNDNLTSQSKRSDGTFVVVPSSLD